jgi:predicted DCC family thiol-disulfide oxidoreductase YuxK/uroporphyrinogen-III synthase
LLEITEPKIFWTRAADDRKHDSTLFESNQELLVNVPCIRTESLEQVFWPDHHIDILVMTSKTCLRMAMASEFGRRTIAQSTTIVSFGKKTSMAIEDSGHQVLMPENVHSAEELSIWLMGWAKTDSVIRVLGPEHPAYPMAESLQAKGLNARNIPIYRTINVVPKSVVFSREYREVLAACDLRDSQAKALQSVVCFASPSAVKGFLAWLDREQVALDHFIALTFSKSTLELVKKHFGRFLYAPENSIESLAKAASSVFNLRRTGVEYIVCFDGVCNLCNEIIDWSIRAIPPDNMRFASLQGKTALALLPASKIKDLDTVVVIDLDKMKILSRSKAIRVWLKNIQSLSPVFRLLLILTPSFLLDLGYRLIVRYRYVLWGRRRQCRVAVSDEDRCYLLD